MPSKVSQSQSSREEKGAPDEEGGVLLHLRVLKEDPSILKAGKDRAAYCLGTVAKFRAKHGVLPPARGRQTKMEPGTYMIAFDHGGTDMMTVDEVVECANLYYQQVSNT